MCVYVDEGAFSVVLFDGDRRARKQHRCYECNRDIEVGETYHRWDGIEAEGDFGTFKMCAHCWAFITVVAQITGCQLAWYYGTVLDVGRNDYEEGAYASDALWNDEHSWRDKPLLKLRVWHWARRGSRHQWRGESGELVPVPAVQDAVTAGLPGGG